MPSLTPTFVCTVILSKTGGITVKVENPDPAGTITQTFILDGTAITTQVQGPQDTSTITQKSDSITIKCKTFEIDAETVSINSTKATTHDSKDAYTVTAVKDMGFKTSTGKMNIEATADDTEAKGVNVKLTAQSDCKIAGLTITQEAQTTAGLKGGTQLNLEGTLQAALKGTSISVAADADLELKGLKAGMAGSGMATVKGGITMIG
jgi:hypothetical protein